MWAFTPRRMDDCFGLLKLRESWDRILVCLTNRWIQQKIKERKVNAIETNKIYEFVEEKQIPNRCHHRTKKRRQIHKFGHFKR